MSQENIIQQLNKTIANLAVLNIKLHNYHWNVQGPHFFSIHQVTEEYYTYFFAQFDELAERVVQLGGKPLASLREFLDAATLREEIGKEFTAAEVIQAVQADFKILLADFRTLSDSGGQQGDPATAALADANIQWLEKSLWMLRVSQA